jgi:hypothetical protein
MLGTDAIYKFVEDKNINKSDLSSTPQIHEPVPRKKYLK